jgi:hypothetical protein
MSVRDKIRTKAKPKIDFVQLDDEKIFVRALSGTSRGTYMLLVEEWKEKGGVPMEVIAALAICEDDGTVAYDHNKPEDIAELADKDAGFLTSVALKLFSISGLTEKAVEAAEKN